MKKFHEIYKEKQTRATELLEGKILNEFKDVYSTLLSKYGISDFYSLNEEAQNTFLTELNIYWSENEGLTEKGTRFLKVRSDVLSESSTTLQKRNFLRNKASRIISETIRQSDLKWKLYDVLDEMYKETSAKSIDDVLTPSTISDIIQETFNSTLQTFISEIKTELNESVKNLSKEDILNLINEKNLNADVVKNKSNILALKINDFNAAKELGDISWSLCYSKGSWDSYSSDYEIVFIYNFNEQGSKRLIGANLQNGRVVAAYYGDDTPVKNISLIEKILM